MRRIRITKERKRIKKKNMILTNRCLISYTLLPPFFFFFFFFFPSRLLRSHPSHCPCIYQENHYRLFFISPSLILFFLSVYITFSYLYSSCFYLYYFLNFFLSLIHLVSSSIFSWLLLSFIYLFVCLFSPLSIHSFSFYSVLVIS